MIFIRQEKLGVAEWFRAAHKQIHERNSGGAERRTNQKRGLSGPLKGKGGDMCVKLEFSKRELTESVGSTWKVLKSEKQFTECMNNKTRQMKRFGLVVRG